MKKIEKPWMVHTNQQQINNIFRSTQNTRFFQVHKPPTRKHLLHHQNCQTLGLWVMVRGNTKAFRPHRGFQTTESTDPDEVRRRGEERHRNRPPFLSTGAARGAVRNVWSMGLTGDRPLLFSTQPPPDERRTWYFLSLLDGRLFTPLFSSSRGFDLRDFSSIM